MIHHIDVLFCGLLALGLCWVGKRVYIMLHPHARVDHELTVKDNLAFALPMGAYYLGVIVALGAPLAAPAEGGWLANLALTAAWGILAVVVLNLAAFLSNKTLLRGLDANEEVFKRRNVSAGILQAGGYTANALVILGALSGSGGLIPAVVFWVYAQAWLALAALALSYLLRCDLARQIGRENRAVALAGAGAIIAVGNILRMALGGEFQGWMPAFAAVTAYAAMGVVCLFVIRELVDRLLLPRVTIQHELVGQETPNIGVGYLVAVFYVGISILVGWCL